MHLASGETDWIDVSVSLNSQTGCRCHALRLFRSFCCEQTFLWNYIIIGSCGRAVRGLPARYVNKLEALFEAIDTNKSGMITEKQLSQITSLPNVYAYLETLDLDVKDK